MGLGPLVPLGSKKVLQTMVRAQGQRVGEGPSGQI